MAHFFVNEAASLQECICKGDGNDLNNINRDDKVSAQSNNEQQEYIDGKETTCMGKVVQ